MFLVTFDVLWNIQNANLCRDLRIHTVTEEIKNFIQNHEQRLHNDHENIEALQRFNNQQLARE